MATVERTSLRDSPLCLRGGVIVAAFVLLAQAVSASDSGTGRLRFSCNSVGCVTNLSVVGDSSGMNWVVEPVVQFTWIGAEYAWGSGSVKVNGRLAKWPQSSSCSVLENGCRYVYRPCPECEVRVTRRAEGDGTILYERYEFANVSSSAIRLTEIDIHAPFNDNYLSSMGKHLASRCHAHVWPGGEGGWVAAMRMGGTAPHLGLAIVEGDASGYGLKERALDKGMSNVRGVIALSPEDALLAPGASRRVAWKVFAHGGWDDFFGKVERLGGIVAEASRYVAHVGENVDVSVRSASGKSVTTWRCPSVGEHRVPVTCVDGRRTWVEILGVGDVDARMLARARFIVERQQVNEPGSPYDGAFVPYDNEEDRQRRRWEPRDANLGVDHSEGGERLGMGVFLAMIAQQGHKDEFLPPLRRYYRFVRNGLQDPDYSSWQCVVRPSRTRCFNYSWIIWFYLEMYRLTGESVYLDDTYGTMRRLFRGDVAVSASMVAMPFWECIEALRKAGRKEDAEQALACCARMAEPIVSNGASLKGREVGMSPEMVSSGLNETLCLYALTREERYLNASHRLMTWAEAICGRQPSWHCHDIGLHHWDGFWFGKRREWGDTLPHDWNGEMAQAFVRYADATGGVSYRTRASGIADAMLGLFTDDGRGSCAWVYPNRVNGRPAHFADPLANDQDWALVFYLWVRGKMARAEYSRERNNG